MITIKIYIDFDGTLYNSTKLYLNFIEIFKKHNIELQSIESILKTDYAKEKNFDILAQKIVKKYNLDQSILNDIDSIYSNDLIFPDALSFLENNYRSHELILLTLGNPQYQEKKINLANINKYFKNIIITNQDKSKLNIDYTNGIFIDNHPYELEKFSKAKSKYLIRIKRNNDKYSILSSNIENILELNSFDELNIENYIKQKNGEFNYE